MINMFRSNLQDLWIKNGDPGFHSGNEQIIGALCGNLTVYHVVKEMVWHKT